MKYVVEKIRNKRGRPKNEYNKDRELGSLNVANDVNYSLLGFIATRFPDKLVELQK